MQSGPCPSPNVPVVLRALTIADEKAWLELRRALWPRSPMEQLRSELHGICTDERQIAIGVFDRDELAGFAELSMHPHAVGCSTNPVAYLEGWYVRPTHRRRGLGRMLVRAGEDWSREQGCREMASDTWLDNDTSHAAHLSLGFTEAERMIHYRKDL